MKTRLVAALCLFLMPLSVPADQAAEREFAWRRATAMMSTANKPSEFLDAARAYQELVDAGV